MRGDVQGQWSLRWSGNRLERSEDLDEPDEAVGWDEEGMVAAGIVRGWKNIYLEIPKRTVYLLQFAQLGNLLLQDTIHLQTQHDVTLDLESP